MAHSSCAWQPPPQQWWAGGGEAWTPDRPRPLSPERPGMWSGRVKLGAGGGAREDYPHQGILHHRVEAVRGRRQVCGKAGGLREGDGYSSPSPLARPGPQEAVRVIGGPQDNDPLPARCSDQSSVTSERILLTRSRDVQRTRVSCPGPRAETPQDSLPSAHSAPAAPTVGGARAWNAPFLFPTLFPVAPEGNSGVTEAQVGAIQGHSACPHPEPQPGVEGWGDASSIRSQLWMAPPCGDSPGGWARGLEAGVPGAGVTVGQRASCLDVLQRLLLVLLRPHLLSPAF